VAPSTSVNISKTTLDPVLFFTPKMVNKNKVSICKRGNNNDIRDLVWGQARPWNLSDLMRESIEYFPDVRLKELDKRLRIVLLASKMAVDYILQRTVEVAMAAEATTASSETHLMVPRRVVLELAKSKTLIKPQDQTALVRLAKPSQLRPETHSQELEEGTRWALNAISLTNPPYLLKKFARESSVSSKQLSTRVDIAKAVIDIYKAVAREFLYNLMEDRFLHEPGCRVNQSLLIEILNSSTDL